MQLHLTIEGNLTADPTINHLEDGTPVAHFRVLHTARRRINGQWQDGATTGVDVTSWGRLAERAVESLNKGDTVIVTGSDPEAQAWVSRDGESRASLTLHRRHHRPVVAIPRGHQPAPRQLNPRHIPTCVTLDVMKRCLD